MGYMSHLYGNGWTIQPPLPWSAFRNVELKPNYEDCPLVKWTVIEHSVDTPDGEFISRQAIGVERVFEDSGKMYELETELEVYAKAIGANGSVASGWFIREGEEQGDVERYGVGEGGTLVVEKATLRWPDGTDAG